MDADLKKILKAVVLEMRHELEGYYDNAGEWFPGDLEQRLAEIGVRKDRESAPADELALADEDVAARKIIDAYISLRQQAGVDRADAVAEYVRESAYTWANRLVALRCMEARELLDDEVIVGREAYGGRSLVHHRLAQTSPELCTGEDDGRFAMLFGVFAERAETLPMLFDPESPSIALRPSPPALKNCLAWLSGTEKVRSQDPATDAVFAAPDALGWAYQYWNTEEKDRVFETVRTKKGAKIEGADIIPATQLYTEDYMVKFLVQNSLGATWMGMHPESQLLEGWEYYVRDADRATAKNKPLRQITLLDPACGSGHFLIEAFDMFYSMYEEEGEITVPEEICKSILENNLFGIDIDERAIQIAEASLWMKAEEKAFGFCGATTNLVAATSSHLKGESWERYLAKLEKEPSTVRVLRKFAVEMEHIDELGSLARPAEALESIIKQEHELWEEQERERHEADKSLFKEIRDDVLASQLPFQDITDQKFFERTMQHALFAIDGFTAEARESGEFNDQLMGLEAKTGFRLLNLLSREYDVVVANPPYMGSKNMGRILRKHVETNFNAGKRDLYAAFILRCGQFTNAQGRFAMVTQQSWMFLRSFSDLRAVEEDKLSTLRGDEQRGLLRETTIETIAHLGPYAFGEISGEVVSTALFAIANSDPDTEQRLTAFRLTSPTTPEAKSNLLRAAIQESAPGVVSRPKLSRFLTIERSPLSYWLSEPLMAFVANTSDIGHASYVRQGICTTDNVRFIRGFWEIPNTDSRWVVFAKGGGITRWTGYEQWVVDWQHNGSRVKRYQEDTPGAIHWSGRMPDQSYFYRSGWTFSRVARGTLGARELPLDSLFCDTSPCAIPYNASDFARVGFWLNTRLLTYLLRSLTQSLDCREGYVQRLPLPDVPSVEESRKWIRTCVQLQRRLTAMSFDEVQYEPTYSLPNSQTCLIEMAITAQLLAIEGAREEFAYTIIELDDGDRRTLVDDLGSPVGWYPMVEGYTDAPRTSADEDETLLILKEIADNNSIYLDELALASLKERVRHGFEGTDPQSSSNTGTPVKSETNVEEVHSQQIPAESLIEEICQNVLFHPFTVFQIISEGIRSDGWRSRACQNRELKNAITNVTLALLGYQWPTQRKNGNIIPDWSDDDGIVPLTNVAKEASLQERVLDRFNKEGVDISNFVDVMGKSVDDWLTTDFFKNLNKQFRKRPIAWQLQTASFTSRKSPVFACIVYYQSVDVDAIQKIRTQYTGPLKLRFETEMRGISSTPLANQTDNQAKRAVELEEAIAELQAFDEKLGAIAKSGFGPAKLLPKLRQYAFDDAMLAMKARWLKRLSELLGQSPGEEAADGTREASPLDQWQDQAIETGMHPELADWIGEALSNLDYFCSQVGPKAPEAKKTPDDPTAADFAELIRSETVTMQYRSIELACVVWWGKFDAAVLAPIKERIKQLKAEQKEVNEEIKRRKAEGTKLKGDDDETTPEPARTEDTSFHLDASSASLKERLKDVKAKIKKFTAEMNSKSAKAQAIRDAIQAWNSSEPGEWHDWLANGPMFDQVASLDDRRSPPKTIAEFIDQESLYAPDINDGVRVNIAPLQKAGVLAADVLAAKDIDKAIADRAEWRSDERRWVREGKLPQCGWWPEVKAIDGEMKDEAEGQSLLVAPGRLRPLKMEDAMYSLAVLGEMLLQRPDGIEPIELAQAFCLLTRKDQLRDALVEHAADVESELANQWHDCFDQQPRAEMLRTLLPDLMSRQFADYRDSLLVPGELLGPSKNPWPRYDAAMALAAAEALPTAQRDEIVEPEVKEMVFQLRLVG